MILFRCFDAYNFVLLIPISPLGHVYDSNVFMVLSLVSLEVSGSCGVSASLLPTLASEVGSYVLATKKSYRKKTLFCLNNLKVERQIS